MSSSSLASILRKAQKFQADAEAIRARKAQLTAQRNRTNLPTADRWPEFARQTWVRSGGSFQRFDPYRYEIDLINRIHASSNTVVLKSRQMGASETVASYLACRAATEPGFAAIVVSKTQQDSSDLGRRVRYMLNSIDSCSFQYTSDSNTTVSIVSGGTLYFLPGSPRAARGIPSGSVLWLDEAEYIEGAQEIYRAASPALSMLGPAAKVIVTSTPGTEVSWYGGLWLHNTPSDWYDEVLAARTHPEDGAAHIEKLNARLALINDEWARVAVHWSQHPIYGADPDWARKQRDKLRLSEAAWNAEFELLFGSTDAQLYPGDLIKRATRGALQECGLLHHTYVLGIDPNAGGSDYFTAIVLDITKKPYSVAAIYHESGRTTEYSLRHIKQLIDDFLPQRITIEKQAMGSVIGEALQGIVPEYVIELFNTSRPSKNVATDRLLYLMEHDAIIFPDGPIPEELRAFQVLDSGERCAAPSFHDDTVMALSFACALSPEAEVASVLFANI